MTPVEFEEMLPAAGQGGLALQSRRDDPTTAAILQSLHDPADAICVDLERLRRRRLGWRLPFSHRRPGHHRRR